LNQPTPTEVSIKGGKIQEASLGVFAPPATNPFLVRGGKKMHKASKKWSVLLIALALFAVVVAACQAAPPDTTTDGGGEAANLQETIDALEGAAGAEGTVSALQTQIAEIPEATEVPDVEATEPPVDRQGGWFDTIVVQKEPNFDAGVERILADDIDVFMHPIGSLEIYGKILENDDVLDFWPSFGLSDEFTFNPSGPEFADGRLNPFSVREIREATNWLVDRDYIVDEILGGLGVPRYTSVSNIDPEMVQYIDVVSEMNAFYAYDPEKAKEVIDAEMEKLGATMGDDGKWQYNDAPVDIILLIRIEDERREMGDYFATQLESIGFTVTRDYKSRSDAAPCWLRTDPTEGCFHIYTGGWSSSAITLDNGYTWGFWFTNLFPCCGSLNPAYVVSDEMLEVSEPLLNNSFETLDERRDLYTRAIRESMKESQRIWLVDQKTFTAYSSDLVASGDLAAGMGGSSLWAYILRPKSGVGGSIDIALPSIIDEPWNGIQGSNSLYDAVIQRAVSQSGVVADPFTGHNIPLRVESGTVTAQEDLPVSVTKDWVALDTAAEITVPGDAWADWDAVESRWITVDEKFPDGTTAKIKSVVVYPADMFETVKWHDGSALSVGDFVNSMIVSFDQGKPDSPYFEPVSQPLVESTLATFKGVKIISTDPLTIETYTDTWFTNAESNVTTWWPQGPYGEYPWHTMALGLMAQRDGTLAFSSDTALEKEVEQMSYLSGPSLDVLSANLATATESNFLPFEGVMAEFVTADEIAERYSNLATWFSRHNHYWVTSGPYRIQRAFPTEGTVILEHNPLFPDPSDRWTGAYSTPAIPVVTIDGPPEVTIGEEATYTVDVTFNDEPYATEDIQQVLYLVFDAEGNLVQQGEAEAGDAGKYTISLDTSELPEGSNRIQVVVVSKLVGVPSFAEQQFVTSK